MFTQNSDPIVSSYSNLQPFLGLNYSLVNQGYFPSRDGFGLGTFIGEVVMFAGVPTLGLSAAGQLLAINQNQALFSILGTTYGGNGTSNFAVPDLRGRIAVGAGANDRFLPRNLGSATGSEAFSVTYPSHNHSIFPSGTLTEAVSTAVNASNLQPELALNYIIALEGIFPSPSSGGGGEIPYVGEVTLFAGNFAPGGWAFAHGQLLPIAEYEALFTVIGTTYGGDGQSTFALPDLRGQTVIGSGTGAGLSPRQIGEAGGTETIVAAPSHSHTIVGGSTTTTDGAPVSFSNLQPFQTLNYIIALEGIFPTFDSPVPSDQFLGEVRLFAGNFAPKGWALAAGQLLSISQNTALFSILGTLYGGDGRTNFALPDLRGRAPVNVGAGVGLSNRALGERGGSELDSLIWPNHTHGVSYPPDFNNDGFADIVWHHNRTGQNSLWYMDGTALESGIALRAANGWNLRAVGDFNGDRSPDLLWRHNRHGDTVLWLMAGGNLAEGIALPNVNPLWQLEAAADFNQDGDTDILWRHTVTGENVVWLMEGTTLTSSKVLPTVPSSDWQIGAVGDFTQDGQVEVIWRHRVTGANLVWFLAGDEVTGTANLQGVGSGWDLIGTADFNQDGHLDLLWRNDNAGSTVIWEMNQLTLENGVVLTPVSSGWTPVV